MNAGLTKAPGVIMKSTPQIADELAALSNFCGITPDAHFMRAIGASPFPNLVEHFAVKRADVGLLQRVGRCHGSAVERPRLSLHIVQRRKLIP